MTNQTKNAELVNECSMMMESEFHPRTLEYVRRTHIDYRKSLGQYFTPQSVIRKLLARVPRSNNPVVLDPGCGTGEFLLAAEEHFDNARLHGWDVDCSLVRIAKDLVPNAQVEQMDALKSNQFGEYDIVIGNPPYYEFNPDEETKTKFREIIKGRVNIYSLFVYQGIRLLREGGYLAYVLSPSMNNGAYFAMLRSFIVSTCNIEYLSVLDSATLFPGASQSVMLLVLRKVPSRGDYTFRRNGVLIFGERVDRLKASFEAKTTLAELGYEVKTGRLVWNDNRHLLTHQAEGSIPLIWSYNVTVEGLKLGNHERPQYVRKQVGYDVGPALVVNRIVGKPGSGTIRAAIVPPGMKFVAENHVNVIFPPKQAALLTTGATAGLEEILRQLNSPDRLWVVQSITGNTQISKNELMKLFPIDAG